MAEHRFVCGKCGTVIIDTTTKGIHKCPGCKSDMALDCRIAIHGNYKTPIHSDSMAISPDQRAEHEQLFPDVELDAQCRPIFDNFTKHKNYMKKCGIVKATQKIKPKSKRIA